jgi:hypothetical protein
VPQFGGSDRIADPEVHMRWTSQDTVGFAVATGLLMLQILFLALFVAPMLGGGRPLGIVGVYAIFIALAVGVVCSSVACWINGKTGGSTWTTHVGVTLLVEALFVLGWCFLPWR